MPNTVMIMWLSGLCYAWIFENNNKDPPEMVPLQNGHALPGVDGTATLMELAKTRGWERIIDVGFTLTGRASYDE